MQAKEKSAPAILLPDPRQRESASKSGQTIPLIPRPAGGAVHAPGDASHVSRSSVARGARPFPPRQASQASERSSFQIAVPGGRLIASRSTYARVLQPSHRTSRNRNPLLMAARRDGEGCSGPPSCRIRTFHASHARRSALRCAARAASAAARTSADRRPWLGGPIGLRDRG